MKTTITLFIFTLSTLLMQAQDWQGYAVYKSQRKVNIQLDSTQLSDDMQKQMLAMMKKQFEKEYTLTFNKDESIYKENEKLDSPGGAMAGGVNVIVTGSGAADVLYKNVSDNRFVNQNELFGKEFLIKDNIPPSEWIKEKETKNIGQYTCFKATYKRMDTIRMAFSSNLDGEKSEKDDVKIEERTVIAWYTPQIPVSHGPRMFGGLPGLILEISNGQESILCSKIVLNPEKMDEIKEPSKGKVVSQVEYDRIMEKKAKEQAEQFGNDGRRKGDGRSFSIRIGG